MNADDPRHGKRAGYLAGCREQCCRRGNLRDVKARQLRVLRDGALTINGGTAIREIVRYWELRGVSIEGVAHAAGVARDVISRVNEGGRDKLLLTSFRKIMAFTEDDLPDDALVYAQISQARICSMMASGHPLTWICEQSPLLVYAGNWRRQERIRTAMARAIRDVYSSVPAVGPSSFTASRSKNYGYLPIAAWDDPGALTMPRGWEPQATVEVSESDIDEAAVLRRMAGERVKLTTAEATEVVTRLRIWNWPHSRIEHHTGLKTERYISRQQVAA